MSEFPLTYCNPIPLPNYPRGRACRDKSKAWGWRNNGRPVDFRETADPSVLFHDGKWYLYPSCGMAWVSEDFCSWRHEPMNIDDVGYAPTIMAHRDKFYLTASGHPTLYVADNPLGPWENVGTVTDPDGRPLPDFGDPMYFADDDGRVYLYWGLRRRRHPGGGDGGGQPRPRADAHATAHRLQPRPRLGALWPLQ